MWQAGLVKMSELKNLNFLYVLILLVTYDYVSMHIRDANCFSNYSNNM